MTGPQYAIVALLVVAAVNALPSSLLHEAAQADRTAAIAAKAVTEGPIVANPTGQAKTEVSHSNKPKVASSASLNKAYKLHAAGFTKRNENSIMKREQLYSDPPGAEYRFFKRDDSDRRRRSTRLQLGGGGPALFPSVVSRNKRDLPGRIDPDDAIALLALWATAAAPHHLRIPDTDYRYELPDLPDDEIMEEELQRQEQEQFPDGWGGEEEYGDRLNVMRRGGPALYPILPYQRRVTSPELGWGEFAPPVQKRRFMINKRRVPQNDVYSLAQLLSERPESPYRRVMF